MSECRNAALERSELALQVGHDLTESLVSVPLARAVRTGTSPCVPAGSPIPSRVVTLTSSTIMELKLGCGVRVV